MSRMQKTTAILPLSRPPSNVSQMGIAVIAGTAHGGRGKLARESELKLEHARVVGHRSIRCSVPSGDSSLPR